MPTQLSGPPSDTPPRAVSGLEIMALVPVPTRFYDVSTQTHTRPLSPRGKESMRPAWRRFGTPFKRLGFQACLQDTFLEDGGSESVLRPLRPRPVSGKCGDTNVGGVGVSTGAAK